MAEFDDYSIDELRSLLQKNRDSQYEISNNLKRISSYEEEYIQMLQEDYKDLDFLYGDWTGEAAEKFILQAKEGNEVIRRQFLYAFSQEQDRLHYERKRLQMEEEDILVSIANVNNKEE